jgi:hypothetical protein
MTYLSGLDFVLLFVDKLLRNSGGIGLSSVEHGPQLAHEKSSVFAVQKSSLKDYNFGNCNSYYTSKQNMI